jgi:hypothetical protein
MIRQVIQIFVYKANLVHFYSSAVFYRSCMLAIIFHYWKLLTKNIFILYTHPKPFLRIEMH